MLSMLFDKLLPKNNNEHSNDNNNTITTSNTNNNNPNNDKINLRNQIKSMDANNPNTNNIQNYHGNNNNNLVFDISNLKCEYDDHIPITKATSLHANNLVSSTDITTSKPTSADFNMNLIHDNNTSNNITDKDPNILGSFCESTIEGVTLAQNIPTPKPIIATKMPGIKKTIEESAMIYTITNKDTGEVYDIRDINHINNKEFQELNQNALSLKNIKAWQDWWANKKRLNKELLTACRYGLYEPCLQLLDKKRGDLRADVNCKGENGWTPLHFSCLNGNYDLVNLLIYHGADIDAETTLKFTPLIITCQKGYEEILNLLIRSGSDINHYDIYHNTPLHYICQKGYKKLAEILLQRPSINLNIRNNENKTAYELINNKEIKQIFDIFITEKSLLDTKFMQKVQIYTTESKYVKKMFNNIQDNHPYPLQACSKEDTIQYPYTNPNTSSNTPTGINIPNNNNITQSKRFYHNHTIQTNHSSNLSYAFNNSNYNTSRQKFSNQATPLKKNELEIDTDMLKQKFSSNEHDINSTSSKQTRFNTANLNISKTDSDVSCTMTTDDDEKIKPGSFLVHSLIGKGSFGEVYLVEKKCNKTLYAMKVLHKSKVMKNNLVKYAMTERNVLSLTNHPFIVKLNYAFQTNDKLFLILDYCPGGDLGEHLRKEKRFTEDRARIYLAEIILALEDLHKRDIIFRDLKPDNIVLDADGHALLTDFGLSKEGVLDNTKGAKSFCGSVAYLAPEMLKRVGHGKAVDWYVLGVVFYEMIVGIPPYYADNKEKIFENIERAPLKIPSYLSEAAKSLLTGLLQRNPAKRLGSGKGDAEEIKSHIFFNGFDWNDVYNKKLKPPIPEQKARIRAKIPINVFDTSSTQQQQPSSQNHITGWSFVASADSSKTINTSKI